MLLGAMIWTSEAQTSSTSLLLTMNDYYFDREEALYEMYEDSLHTFEEDQEEQEDQEEDYYNHPSLSASSRNPSLR